MPCGGEEAEQWRAVRLRVRGLRRRDAQGRILGPDGSPLFDLKDGEEGEEEDEEEAADDGDEWAPGDDDESDEYVDDSGDEDYEEEDRFGNVKGRGRGGRGGGGEGGDTPGSERSAGKRKRKGGTRRARSASPATPHNVRDTARRAAAAAAAAAADSDYDMAAEGESGE